MLCYSYAVFPVVDLTANEKNTKCPIWRDNVDENIMVDTFLDDLRGDVWCNPPHTKTEFFVRLCMKLWNFWNVNVMMIIPANSICTKYAEECIEPHAEYHPIFFRPKFLKNGEEKDSARNSYFVVIWRKNEEKN